MIITNLWYDLNWNQYQYALYCLIVLFLICFIWLSQDARWLKLSFLINTSLTKKSPPPFPPHHLNTFCYLFLVKSLQSIFSKYVNRLDYIPPKNNVGIGSNIWNVRKLLQMLIKFFVFLCKLQWKPINLITLIPGVYDFINRMITITDGELFSHISKWDLKKSDYNSI